MKRILLAAAIMTASTAATVGCTRVNAPTSSGDASRGIVIIESDVDAFAIFGGGAPNSLKGGVPNPMPIKPGMYALAIEAEGYLTRRYDLQVNAGEEVSISLEMWPAVEELDQ